MKKRLRRITDEDFLPRTSYKYLYLSSNKRNRQYEELYQLIFGILKHHNIDDIYQLLLILLSKQETDIIRNIKLKFWREELQIILTNLKRYKVNGYTIQVVLPYLWSKRAFDLTFVTSIFQWTVNIIDEISNFKGELILPQNTTLDYPLPQMSKLFAKYMLNEVGVEWNEEDASKKILDIARYLNNSKGEVDLGQWGGKNITDKLATPQINSSGDKSSKIDIKLNNLRINASLVIIHYNMWLDEMTRRGFSESAGYKSIYYDEINYRRYYVRADISEEELMSTDLLPLSHVEDNTTDKEKTAVIYFMLKDKVEKNTISTICNYVAGKKYNSNIRRKNSNSIDRYIRSCQKEVLDECDYTKEKMKNVAKILEEYEIEVPAKVKTFIEQ